MPREHLAKGDSAMFEKLLLAAALTLSIQIFAGASTSTKLPKTYVLRSLSNQPQTVKLPVVEVPNRRDIDI